MGLADDIRDLLSTGGMDVTAVFCGDLPERPPACVVIVQTAGPGSTHTFGSAVGVPPLEGLGFQLRARAAGYVAAETAILAAHARLDGLRDKAINGKRYHWVAANSSPYYIGADAEARPIFACNYQVKRSLST